ncbi:hypothetical protein, partial [Leisingera sp. MMG026]
QGIDYLMLIFVFTGAEQVELGDSILPAIGSATIDMRYSHDLLPVLGWALAAGFLVYIFFRNWVVTAWCFGLVILHELCDLVTGYPHNFHGPDTAEFGLQLWVVAPVAGTIAEAGLGVACVAWFLHRYKVSSSGKWTLFLLMGATPFLLLPLVLR